MNNISKDKLLSRLNSYRDTNQQAIDELNKKIAEYREERANKHYWHNGMGIILNKFIANKESREKTLCFFQKQISDLESGKKGAYIVLNEIKAKYKIEFNEIKGGVR